MVCLLKPSNGSVFAGCWPECSLGEVREPFQKPAFFAGQLVSFKSAQKRPTAHTANRGVAMRTEVDGRISAEAPDPRHHLPPHGQTKRV